MFFVEMKCEIEYQNVRYFVLDGVEQLLHHKKDAFRAFLATDGDALRQRALVDGWDVAYDGAILVWGAVTETGRRTVIEQTGLHDVLSVEQICEDLVSWKNESMPSCWETDSRGRRN